MKIRNGFVSNSSSSSFLISERENAKISEVAKDMIEIRNKDNNWHDIDLETLKKYKTDGYNIAFPTCNYRTYITKTSLGLYIMTCNNHDWSDIRYKYNIDGDNGGEDLDEFNLLEREYWFLDHNIIAKLAPDEMDESYKTCYDNHYYSEILLINNKEICPICDEKYIKLHQFNGISNKITKRKNLFMVNL